LWDGFGNHGVWLGFQSDDERGIDEIHDAVKAMTHRVPELGRCSFPEAAMAFPTSFLRSPTCPRLSPKSIMEEDMGD
jgi:hypothetical protein